MIVLNLILVALFTIVLFISLINIPLILKGHVPRHLPVYRMRNILLTRTMFTVLLASMYIVMNLSNLHTYYYYGGEYLWLNIAFDYTLAIVLLCDTWITRVYLQFTGNLFDIFSRKRKGDRDDSGIEKRRCV